MSRLINIDDSRNCYIGMDGEYETWNIDPNVIAEAQSQRKTGKWQVTDAYPHNVYCSECHKKFAQTHWAVWEDGSLPRNFCPHCGSYNGGEE